MQQNIDAKEIMLAGIGSLTKGNAIITEHFGSLMEKIKSLPDFGERIACKELWIILAITLYALVMLFRGVCHKRIMLFSFVLSIVYMLLLPHKDRCAKIFQSIFRMENPPPIIQSILDDPLLSTLLFASLITLVIMALYNYLCYIPFLVIAFECRNIFSRFIDIENTWLTLAIVAGIFAILYIYRKAFNIIENIVLSIIFSANGANLVLKMSSVAFDWPKNFMGPGETDQALNIGLLFLLALVGFVCQIKLCKILE